VKNGSLDPLILAAKTLGEKKKKPINFDEFDFITDAVSWSLYSKSAFLG
jgi:hypothetical protein